MCTEFVCEWSVTQNSINIDAYVQQNSQWSVQDWGNDRAFPTQGDMDLIGYISGH